MLNVTLWIRNAYPFRWEEVEALRKAIVHMWDVQVECQYGMHKDGVYYDTVTVYNVTMKTAQQIASAIKLFHLQKALHESRPDSRVHAEDVEVEVRGHNDRPPEWARY